MMGTACGGCTGNPRPEVDAGKGPRRPVEVIPVMLGTAGHVDHGKTSLVKLLTGCDTDRLPEEKRRGMTIDLGFAPCLLPGNRLAGIVDVPGHEDFIKNMVAGASSMDVLMLVVAADDGIMPQTVEHLKIVKLLRTPAVMAVVTKIDKVDAARLGEVRQELAVFLAGMGFPGAPVACMSNISGEGIGEVWAALEKLVEGAIKSGDPRAFRMNVERVFNVGGYGTIATGIPVSGGLSVGDAVEILPAARRAAVRSIQNYHRKTQATSAHVCSAVNLRDISPEELGRGMALAEPGIFEAKSSAMASLKNVSGDCPVRNGMKFLFHAGTSMAQASVSVLGSGEVEPGAEGFLRWGFAEPLILAAGDRYIVRSLSPLTTVAGGWVLGFDDGPVKRKDSALLERLAESKKKAEAGDFFGAAMLAGGSPALESETLLRMTQRKAADAREELRAKELSGELVSLGDNGWLIASRVDEARFAAAKALARYHAENPEALGMEATFACGLLGLSSGSFERLAAELCKDGTIALIHGRLALSSFRPRLGGARSRLREEVLARVNSAGMTALACGTLQNELSASEEDLRAVLRMLGEEKLVFRLGAHLLCAPALYTCRNTLLDLFKNGEALGLPDFRKATGLGRNLAVEVLEHFDKEGLTRRLGEKRVLAKKRSS